MYRILGKSFMNPTIDKPTIMSTKFALMFANQYRGLTAIIRHLLSKTVRTAIQLKPLHTMPITSTGSNIKYIV